jgi:hypothetical protein
LIDHSQSSPVDWVHEALDKIFGNAKNMVIDSLRALKHLKGWIQNDCVHEDWRDNVKSIVDLFSIDVGMFMKAVGYIDVMGEQVAISAGQRQSQARGLGQQFYATIVKVSLAGDGGG